MGRRLSTKHRKRRRDQATAYRAGKAPKRHKIAKARSRKARKKNAHHAY